MKVVITGGAGFLGKKLARRLLQDGDRRTRGQARAGERARCCSTSARRAAPASTIPGVRTLAGDIANFATVQSIVQGAATVFHFAAVVSAGRRGRFRPGLPGQPRRHAQRPGGLPRARHQSARGLHQLAGGVRRRPAAGRDRRHGADAADLLRRAEVDRRVPDPRLHPQGIFARHLGAAADDLRAHRPAQQGGLDLGLLGGARAADRRRRRLPGDARDHHGGPEPAQDGRRLRAPARPAARRLRPRPHAAAERHQRHGQASSSRRSAATPATARSAR